MVYMNHSANVVPAGKPYKKQMLQGKVFPVTKAQARNFVLMGCLLNELNNEDVRVVELILNKHGIVGNYSYAKKKGMVRFGIRRRIAIYPWNLLLHNMPSCLLTSIFTRKTSRRNWKPQGKDCFWHIYWNIISMLVMMTEQTKSFHRRNAAMLGRLCRWLMAWKMCLI